MDLGLLANRLTTLLKNADIEFLHYRDEDGERIIVQLRTPVFTVHIPLTEKQTAGVCERIEGSLEIWVQTFNRMGGE